MDETSKKILDSTMNLIMTKGYSATTTKEIATIAGINESTIFRKFQGKKDIVLTAMKQKEWHPDLKSKDFEDCKWQLQEDLVAFSKIYMKKVTPQFVKVSIGLRSPDLYEDTAEWILQTPLVFKEGLLQYFQKMMQKGHVSSNYDIEALAMSFLAINFGFVFFRASFANKLSSLCEETYISNCVNIFVAGIQL